MSTFGTVGRMVSLFATVLLLELAMGAAAVHPERLQGLLWVETSATFEAFSGPALHIAETLEASLLESLAALAPPHRATGESLRLPGLQPESRAAQIDESEGVILQAFGRILGSGYFESIRLMGLLALRRLAKVGAVLILALPLLLAFVLDGFLVRRLRQARFKAPRPTLFSSLGTLLGTLPAGTILLAHLPLAIPLYVWGLTPLLLGMALRGCAASWHRFD